MNKISYSQYSTWANCPLAWKLKYVDGNRIEDNSIEALSRMYMNYIGRLVSLAKEKFN